MSGSYLPYAAAAQPKQISSRLLNMKFMQRAAASDNKKGATSPQTPSSGPPLKRRKTGEHAYTGNESPSTPNTPYGTSNFSQGDIDTPSASKAQNHFGDATIETQWVLNVKLPTVRAPFASNGSSWNAAGNEEDDDDEEADEDDIWNSDQPSGRQTYGAFKKKSARPTTTITTSGEDASSTSQSLSKSAKRNAKKRDAPYDDDDRQEKDSESDSDSDSDIDSNADSSSSVDGTDDDNDISDSEADPSAQIKRKPSRVDFMSDEYTKKLDKIDFSKSGAMTGLGKQRPGLSGGGGGGGSNHNRGRRSQGNTPKGRRQLGGQEFMDSKRGQHGKRSTKKAKRQTM